MSELLETEYEVRFDGGAELVFDADGVWKKVDCHMASVPEALVPAEILEK